MIVPKKKILIIDDEGDLVEMMVLRFEMEGFLVDIALHGDLGVEKALAFKPDVILLDLVMPGVDGLEVCRRLRAEEQTKNIPVILLTAAQIKDVAEQAHRAGATKTMLKPYDNQELLKTIRTLTESHSAVC